MGQIVMQEDWFPVFKVRVTVRAHLIKYDCFYHMHWTTDLFLQPNLIGWYIIISWTDLCKKYIVVFKVKVSVKVQNSIESLCILYLLFHWSAGLLLLTIKPNTTKWACTDSSTLTYSIIWHVLEATSSLVACGGQVLGEILNLISLFRKFLGMFRLVQV